MPPVPYTFVATFCGVGDIPYADPRLVKLEDKFDGQPLQQDEIVVVAPCMRKGEVVYYCHCGNPNKGA